MECLGKKLMNSLRRFMVLWLSRLWINFGLKSSWNVCLRWKLFVTEQLLPLHLGSTFFHSRKVLGPSKIYFNTSSLVSEIFRV